MIIAARVHYSGRVQGVGFRYTAQSVALGFDVAGHVRNLTSGEVELVAEGEAGEVDSFLAALAQRMSRYIASTRREALPPSARQGFRVLH